MKAALVLAGLISVSVACAQDDGRGPRTSSKEKTVDGKAFLRGVLAAERKAFGTKPIEATQAVRDQSFSRLKRTGTRLIYDKQYARFVTEVERAGLLNKPYRLVVDIGKVSPGQGEGVFTVETTWTPMKRGWRRYMTASEKQDYGRSTGRRRGGIFVQKVYTASDRSRDDRIEEACHQRKQRIEEIRVRIELSADQATDIRLVETAEIIGTIRDFSITYYAGAGHKVNEITMDVTDLGIRK